jgi:cytochrome P450
MTQPGELRQASRSESGRFTALVALPNLAEGLFRRRPAVSVLLDRIGVPHRAHRLLAALQSRYGDGPMWVSVAGKKTLLVFGPDQIQFALSHAPEPFASDPEPKRSGMEKFQPHALTISRGEHWSDRRRFTDAVLSTAAADTTIQGRIRTVAADAAVAVPREVDWHQFNALVQRMARRIILGDVAMHDDDISTQLATLMSKANPPGKGDPELYGRFFESLHHYVHVGEAGSLVGLFHRIPVTEETHPTHQVIHWLFAMGDTLAINLWRCLALLANHPDMLSAAHMRVDAGDSRSYLAGCLCEAMRLWPSTPVLARTLTRDIEWNGRTVPEGTQAMIINTFNHRDKSRIPYADRFEPTAWVDHSADRSWSFNFFSHGPQQCPGADLALRLGVTFLAALLGDRHPDDTNILLDPAQPLPLTLNHTRLRLGFAPRGRR